MASSSKRTQAVHAGSLERQPSAGLVTPVFPSSAYDYHEVVRYPRYFNTPNHEVVAAKVARLENGEAAFIFGSGMAAITTSLLAFLQAGEHAIFPFELYGGTYSAVLHELPRYGISYSLVNGEDPEAFRAAIRPETRVIYLETPSNPLLRITDVRAVTRIAQQKGIVTLIDNTFASPVNQNPIDLGVDVVLHSGTKYLGGHSDLCCGAAITSKEHIEKIRARALHLGGSLDAHALWLLERSLKTLVLRVEQQNKNALALALFLEQEKKIKAVYYPGLKNHPGHSLAKRQMKGGFGGMLSFEIKGRTDRFLRQLKHISRAISLGGVESTITEPIKTSHSKMPAAERARQGITPQLLRLSVGIEDVRDLCTDLGEALQRA